MAAQAGQQFHLDELTELMSVEGSTSPLKGLSVRVVGVLTSLDFAEGMATIKHRGASLVVDMTMVESSVPYHVGDWLQAIGELFISDRSVLTLRARICTVVNGLNVELYEKAVDSTRKFAHALLTGSGGS